MFLTQLLAVTTITILGTMSPGPDFAIVTRNSLKYSRNLGIMTALGVATGLGVHVTYSLVGIGLIIAKSIILFTIIKYMGAIYLFYIGIQALRSKPHIQNIETSATLNDSISSWVAFKMGFLTNALNPKATLFFLAVFTQVISPETILWVKLFFGIEIMCIAFVWFATLSYCMTIGRVQNVVRRIQHHVEHVMGAALIALGIKVAFFTYR